MKTFFALLFVTFISGCSMTAGGDMKTTTQVNPTVSPDVKFNNVGGGD